MTGFSMSNFNSTCAEIFNTIREINKSLARQDIQQGLVPWFDEFTGETTKEGLKNGLSLDTVVPHRDTHKSTDHDVANVFVDFAAQHGSVDACPSDPIRLESPELELKDVEFTEKEIVVEMGAACDGMSSDVDETSDSILCPSQIRFDLKSDAVVTTIVRALPGLRPPVSVNFSDHCYFVLHSNTSVAGKKGEKGSDIHICAFKCLLSSCLQPVCENVKTSLPVVLPITWSLFTSECGFFCFKKVKFKYFEPGEPPPLPLDITKYFIIYKGTLTDVCDNINWCWELADFIIIWSFSIRSVHNDMKLWSFKVILRSNIKLMILVHYIGEEKQCAYKNITPIDLIIMGELTEVYHCISVRNALDIDTAYFNGSRRQLTKNDLDGIDFDLDSDLVLSKPTAIGIVHTEIISIDPSSSWVLQKHESKNENVESGVGTSVCALNDSLNDCPASVRQYAHEMIVFSYSTEKPPPLPPEVTRHLVICHGSLAHKGNDICVRGGGAPRHLFVILNNHISSFSEVNLIEIRQENDRVGLGTIVGHLDDHFKMLIVKVGGETQIWDDYKWFTFAGMQVMSKEDSETLKLCKKMLEVGEWPPLMVVFDPREGFTVETDKSIKDLTIITEYTGDVDYLKNRENDDGDSIMTLLSTLNFTFAESIDGYGTQNSMGLKKGDKDEISYYVRHEDNNQWLSAAWSASYKFSYENSWLLGIYLWDLLHFWDHFSFLIIKRSRNKQAGEWIFKPYGWKLVVDRMMELSLERKQTMFVSSLSYTDGRTVVSLLYTIWTATHFYSSTFTLKGSLNQGCRISEIIHITVSKYKKYKNSVMAGSDEWPSTYSKNLVKLGDGPKPFLRDPRRLVKVSLLQDLVYAPIFEFVSNALMEPRFVIIVVDIGLCDQWTDIWKLNLLNKYKDEVQFISMIFHDTSTDAHVELPRTLHYPTVNKSLYKVQMSQILNSFINERTLDVQSEIAEFKQKIFATQVTIWDIAVAFGSPAMNLLYYLSLWFSLPRPPESNEGKSSFSLLERTFAGNFIITDRYNQEVETGGPWRSIGTDGSCFDNIFLDDFVSSAGYINHIFMFSLPRPPDIVDLEDKVILKEEGMLRAQISQSLGGLMQYVEVLTFEYK